MDYFRPPTFSMFPPVVKNLLIINAFCFATTLVLEHSNFTFHGNPIDLNNILGLHFFQSSSFHFYQILTYMFMHGGFQHIAFNMFALWMFGYTLENLWGAKRFLIFYLICGIGAGVTQEIFQYFYFQHVHTLVESFVSSPLSDADMRAFVGKNFGFTISGSTSPGEYTELIWQAYHKFMDAFVTIGASGAIFGILLAFGMIFPNTELLIYFLFPIKAKYFVIVYGLLELFFAVSNKPGDDVAHFAHLGGMVFGFILIMYWRSQRRT